jgi:hypothetical protein
VVERGQDFAVFQRFRARAQADGSLHWQSGGRYTLLENGLHYRDPVSGQWQESRDLIERFPDGALARYGPLRAIFSHDLNAESVFDLETPAGARLRGGLRALEWLDEATGQRQPLARVRASAPLELVPPNWLVARDAFDGVAADVVLEWRHNRFSQSVVLRELPWPPEGFAPDTTRLVVVTEWVEAPEPVLQRVAVPGAGGVAVSDDVGIHFDGASILQGHAFAVRAGSEWAWQVGAGGAPGEAVEVRKVWTPDGAGGAMLEESVAWEALARLAAELPRQARTAAPGERDWRSARAERVSARQPVEVAQLPYWPAGVVVDFELNGSAYSYTFVMGETYYIPNNFTVGPGVATFQAGCTIKYANNAWMKITGPTSFADTLQTPVFTSKDDDSFGEKIAGSTGLPNFHASPAVGVYYDTYSTIIRKARFRWAKTAVQYDSGPGYALTHYLQDTLFESCLTAVRIGSGITVHPSGLEKHDVTTAFAVTYPGSCGSCIMTPAPFYTDKSFAGLNGDDGGVVPDTMGAIGLTRFIAMTTGAGKVVAFDRVTGTRTNETSLTVFFNPPGGTNSMADPRIWYDHFSERWVSCAMHSDSSGTNDAIVLQVSLTDQPSLLNTNDWLRFPVPIPLDSSNWWVDFPVLGVDTNGFYVSVQVRSSDVNNRGYRVQAFKKPDVYSTNAVYQPPPPLVLSNWETNTWCIQPAYNFDASPVGGYAWFVAKGPSSGNLGGQIYFRRLQWNGPNPEWVGNWQVVEGPYRDYYDIPQVSGTNSVLLAPHKDGTALELGNLGSRLMTAVIRNGYLWTCHHVGLDGVDGDYDGPTADRSAVQWFKLQVSSGGLAYASHGRIYDTASSNPYWYHFPSLNVNAAGDLVVGFSGSRATEYIGAFFRGRRANGTWMNRPAPVQAGRGAYTGGPRWGDYSATSMDPTPDSQNPNFGTFWTVQQYADPVPERPWGTWITQVKASP